MTNWTNKELQEAYDAAYDLNFMGRWREALRLARAIYKRDPKTWRSAVVAGGVLIDASEGLGRPGLAREAAARMEAAMGSVPNDSLFAAHYNLGNAYLVIGQRQPGKGPATRLALGDAIDHLDVAAAIEPGPSVQTNLANALDSQGRVVEAIEEYNRVIKAYPEYGEARLNRAAALAFAAQAIQPHKGLLEVAVSDARKALELFKGDSVRIAQCERLLEKYEKEAPHVAPTTTKPTRVAKWIWEKGLNLNICPYCEEETPEAFDLYALQGFHSDSSKPERVEQVHDMLNAIHQSFSTARWQALQGFGVCGRVPRDPVVIQRAARDAHHDLRIGLLLAATTGFYDVIHQVAAATDSYFRLGHNPFGIDLARIWWPSGSRKKGIPRQRKDLHPRFQRTRHTMLSALYRLALSCERGTGRYAPLRKLRNDIEHHVVVVREGGAESSMYKSVERARLREDVLAVGRIAKAALLYLGGSIWLEEFNRLKKRSGKSGPFRHGTKWVDRT